MSEAKPQPSRQETPGSEIVRMLEAALAPIEPPASLADELEQRLVGVAGDRHLVTRVAQIDRDQLRDRRLVFDNQNSAHQRTIVSTVATGLWRTSVPLTT